MLGAHMMSHDLNQPRGPITSLKEEPLGRWQLQQPDQTKLVHESDIDEVNSVVFLDVHFIMM